MLKRKIYDVMLQWKNNGAEKCLLIKGARQVGKTYIIREFGQREYQSFIEINFVERPDYKMIFSGALSADSIYANISLVNPQFHFTDGDTLVFFDEIQECPEARTALKFLAGDSRFHVIASGSLLGISFKDVTSIPVGYEQQLTMYPLDFEEFLWAKGYEASVLESLRKNYENREKVNPAVNEIFLGMLREYMVVGGMPAVVNTFQSSHHYGDVYEMQRMILNSYYDDISKYAEPFEKPKIKKCYESIPAQLAKENKKFQFSVVEKGSSARKFGNSIDWLKNSGLVHLCYNVSTPSFPLKAYEETDYYKVYVTDIGLLTALYGFELKAAIINDTLAGPAKGGLYENLIACMLVQQGYSLRYYRAQTGSAEIEFLIEQQNAVIPIEVKAKNGTSKSLNQLLEQYEMPYGYKFIAGNVGVLNKKISLPQYMAMFL